MTKRHPEWPMGMIHCRDFANATRGGLWASTAAGAWRARRSAAAGERRVRRSTGDRGSWSAAAGARRSAASAAEHGGARQPERGGARWAPVRRRGSTRPATIQGGHLAFDLPGGLGYAPPALDGIAVERASAPVAASVTRET